MDPIVQEQARRNRLARDCWQCYASHRAEVGELLGGGPLGRLCLLGAGNCNDVDLNLLVPRCTQIRLVDLDAEALAYGVAAQRPEHVERIVLDAGRDLSGIADLLAGWSPAAPPSAEQIEACIARAAAADSLPHVPPQDTVVSLCLLSQLVEAVISALGADHPRLLDVIAAVRTAHLRLMLDLLRPGGRGVLITDFVSSDTCRSLTTTPAERLPALAMQLIQQRNFFTGLNPFVLLNVLNTDPALGERLEHAQLTGPWLWQYPGRTYAVCGLQMIRGAIRKSSVPS